MGVSEEMKTVIAGGRNFTDYKLLKWFCNMETITRVFCGGASGADKLGRQWAESKDIPVDSYPANWKLYGRAAGPIRNQDMAHDCDRVIVFWDGKSKGTQNMIESAQALRKPVTIIRY